MRESGCSFHLREKAKFEERNLCVKGLVWDQSNSSIQEDSFKFRFSDFCLKETIWKFEKIMKVIQVGGKVQFIDINSQKKNES